MFRDLESFIRDASARGLIRRAFRATRHVRDADARKAVEEEIRTTVRATPRARSKEEGARGLSEARRRLKELEEMILMAK